MVQVNSWAIRDGRCYYRNRYVRTGAFMAEQEAGRMLYKGAFSRGDPAGDPSPFAMLMAEALLSSHAIPSRDAALSLCRLSTSHRQLMGDC